MFSYIFYKLYKLSIKSEKQWNTNIRIPQVVAYFSLSIFQVFNFFTLIIVLSHGFNLFVIGKPNPLIAILIIGIIYIFNYTIFIKNRRYLNIEKRYDRMPKKKLLIKDILFWIYALGTFPLLLISLEILVAK